MAVQVMEVVIEKLVHGGQGLATLPDGRKVFVWGALPGETVRIRITKTKKSFAEAITEEVIEPSSLRVPPREDNYLATSPWQILPLEAENDYKTRIVHELYTQAHATLPDFKVTSLGSEWQYRNKMEYSFWGDEDGLHLALFTRGSHRKHIVEGSSLAMPAIDTAAQAVLTQLQKLSIRAGDLKTIIVRCSQKGDTVVALFVRPKTFPALELTPEVQGIRIYHSNPKSPASVPTQLLHEIGTLHLSDELLGKAFQYDVDSFFQVNIPVFEQALEDIRAHGQAESLVDMYAGVGSIGLSVATKEVQLIELDPATAIMARHNAEQAALYATVIEAPSEKAVEYIVSDRTIIFDPPRAGLHDTVVAKTLEAVPPKVIYLSCNPATQARDLAKLQEKYKIIDFKGYNFFPHTPHIETLAVLERK